MTDKEAKSLATEIAKTSNGVSVKFGHTNGQAVLHCRNKLTRESNTLRSRGEWLTHRWHKNNAQPGPDLSYAGVRDDLLKLDTVPAAIINALAPSRS